MESNKQRRSKQFQRQPARLPNTWRLNSISNAHLAKKGKPYTEETRHI